MEISVIASGSNGNCCLIEHKDVSLMIDAGKSCKEITRRMEVLGKSIENVDAILITHMHSDHFRGSEVIARKHNIPVYMAKNVYNGFLNYEPKLFGNKAFKIKNLEVKPVATSHNVSSCGFVIGKFGIFTDTGKVTDGMKKVFPKLNGVLLESNHDIDMVINGPYPHFLKQWILSEKGHLSNFDASNFIQEKGKNLSLVLLGHLSGNNNTPDAVKIAFETLVRRKIEYGVCSRDKESGKWEI